MTPPPPERQSPSLSRAQCLDVLRYWLASVRLEEALSARPRARRGTQARLVPRVDAPTAGQEYFKLPLDEACLALLESGRSFRRPLDAESAAFFETWLVQQYRRADVDAGSAHWLAFPVVHLRRGELAGLLRYRTEVMFAYSEGGMFEVPHYRKRRQQHWPAPPDEIRVSVPERKPGQWPFFIDTRLWSQQLGVRAELIDALFADLRTRESIDESHMLLRVAQTLEAELSDAPPAFSSSSDRCKVETSLERVFAAAQALLERHGPSGKIYRVGIMLDASATKTTGHLQRELQMLVGERDGAPWTMDSPLGAYLSGRAPLSSQAIQRAAFRGSTLTPSQRAAAEHFWGSMLTAVQGPPGTGKTTLILHLCAESLVRQVETLLEPSRSHEKLLLVTSTNNRAVDNVVEPLIGIDPDLPVALRAGSRIVCEQHLTRQLQRVREWLSACTHEPQEDRERAFETARAEFDTVRMRVDALHAPRVRRLALLERRTASLAEIAALRSEVESSTAAEARALGLTAELATTLAGWLPSLMRRLEVLSERCESVSGTKGLRSVVRLYRTAAAEHVEPLLDALTRAGLAFDLGLPAPLPPDSTPHEALECWQDAIEVALARLIDLDAVARAAQAAASHRLRLASLERDVAELEASGIEQAAESPDEDHTFAGTLFEAALAVRKAWAAANAEVLLPSFTLAERAAGEDRSLRSFARHHPRAWSTVRRLFGIWGCTLLSIGNVFDPDPEILDRVVIDEAGQCHPAYATSALLRARQALIIGDVHQLEPVVDLSPEDDDRAIQSARISLNCSLLEPYRIHRAATTSVQSVADRAVTHRLHLRDHFRCQREIIAICDALCDYGLEIHTPRRTREDLAPALHYPVLFLDEPGEQVRLGGSWHNPAQCSATLHGVQTLLRHGLQPSDIAVITPYRGQLEQLRRGLLQLGIPLTFTSELGTEQSSSFSDRGLALGTVHRFQGGERSIVFLTTVVTQRPSLAFLDDRENLLNVALSRAQHHFIAIGDRRVLALGRRTSLLVGAARGLVF